MDAYLGREALKALEALRRLAPRRATLGFLLGHTRGHRFFVENIFPAPSRAWPSLDEFYGLDRLFEGRIIGFFAFRQDEKIKRHLLAPFAVGKAYLEISPSRVPGKIRAAASVVDFDGRFRFVRLPLRAERAASPRLRGRP
jgi:hypothetical protein